MSSKTKSILFAVLTTSMILVPHTAIVQGQGNTRPATGGGSSSKTKTQAEEMLQQGIPYKDPARSATSSESSQPGRTNPSMQETIDFISRYLGRAFFMYDDPVFGGNETYFVIGRNALGSFQTMEGKQETINPDDVPIEIGFNYLDFERKFILRLGLKDLDPSGVRVISAASFAGNVAYFEDAKTLVEYKGYPFKEHSILILSTRTGQRSMRVTLNIDNKDVRTAEVNVIFFAFKDRDTPERVSKALQHAIKLSGGKPEPF